MVLIEMDSATAGANSARTPLVGRDEELARAEPLLSELERGRGGILWIEGEAGIGKSALADEIGRRAAVRGAQRLDGSGDALPRSFPLRLMAACLGVPARRAAAGPDAAAVDQIAALLSGEPSAAGVADPVLAAAERMLDLVDRRCARGPVLLTADNLQWADDFSLQVWSRLAYAVNQIPLLLIGIYRPGSSRSSAERLRETARARGGMLVRPGPLPEQAAADLAERVTGRAPGPRLRAELARAAGNPLYIRELLNALVDEGMVAVGDGLAEFEGAPGATPSSLAEAIGRRLEFLSPRTLAALRTAALLGTEFDAGAAAVATGLPVSVLAQVIAQAEAAGILKAAGERLAFRHELIQQALVEQYGPRARREQHARIARALAYGGAGLDVVAPHLSAAPDDLGAWAPEWLATVPRSTLYAAPAASAELLARAVRQTASAEPSWGELVQRRTQVLMLLGRDAELIDFASAAAARTGDPELAARLTVAVARAAGRAGRPDDAIESARRALARDGLPAPLRARLETWQSVAHTTVGRGEQGRVAAVRALEEARSSNDPLALAYAHHAAAFAATTAEGVGHIDEALALLGSDAESMDLRVLLTHNRLIWLVRLGRVREYEEELPGALMLAERVGTPRATGLLGAAAEEAFRRGDWEAARLHLESIDAAYIDSPDGLHLHGLGAVAALHRAEGERAAAHLAAVEAVSGPETRVPRTAYLIEARALRAEADGDRDLALALLATLLDAPPGLRRDERLDETPHLVRLALEVGDRETARRALDAIEAATRAESLAGRSAAARFCRAQFEDDEEELCAVAELYEAFGWPLHAGAALEEAAVRAARAAEIVRARQLLTKAVRTYAVLGAELDIRRAESRLRALGVRRGPRSARTRETTGWGALTESELKIAKLVGAGWSNPDIATELSLSRRTVQTHVSNILGKLRMHSRLDVVRALAGPESPFTS